MTFALSSWAGVLRVPNDLCENFLEYGVFLMTSVLSYLGTEFSYLLLC
jgi:hypothetical protein